MIINMEYVSIYIVWNMIINVPMEYMNYEYGSWVDIFME